jgi:Opacity family porin protein
MKLSALIAISAVASILTQTAVFAQEAPGLDVVPTAETPAAEKSAEKSSQTPDEIVPAAEKSAEKSSQTPGGIAPAPEKKYSIGPAIQFGGGGTSFGITGKYKLGDQFSVRPIFLFGYKPTVTTSNVTKSLGATYSASAIDTITDTINNGSISAYGIAATYDFRSPDNKTTGYVGPRILTSSGSLQGTSINGFGITAVNIPITEINVGLTGGVDFTLTPDLTAGINATYNFYRGIRIDSTDIQSTGSSFNLGINVAYNF